MIDPHVHLRDGKQSHKETVKHGLSVAYRAGLDAVFEMPNTDPALTSMKTIDDRIILADQAIEELGVKIFHGLYAGITADPKQIKEVVRAHKRLFPRVVGLKMFAGHSTGNMGIIDEDEQKSVYRTLAKLKFDGVLAVHCEKERYIEEEVWNPEFPITHCFARGPLAEIASVDDQIRFAQQAGYKGTLHICHISVPESLEYIERGRKKSDFEITCGITPHHAFLWDTIMSRLEEDGLLLKMNPPLRSKILQDHMVRNFYDGRIDWIETDHAPHTLEEKTGKALDGKGNPMYASGIPVLPYYPNFIRYIEQNWLDTPQVRNLTHNNIVRAFDLPKGLIPDTRREPDYNLAKEYPFDAFGLAESVK